MNNFPEPKKIIFRTFNNWGEGAEKMVQWIILMIHFRIEKVNDSAIPGRIFYYFMIELGLLGVGLALFIKIPDNWFCDHDWQDTGYYDQVCRRCGNERSRV